MTTPHERKQALIEHKIITDVLPGDLDLQYGLVVELPTIKLNKAGDELERDETQAEPTVFLGPAVRTPEKNIRTQLTCQPSESLKDLVLIVADAVCPFSER